MELKVNIGNKSFANPVGVCSGTFGYGKEYNELYDVNKLGAIFSKAVTLEHRDGNPPPRLIETPSGMLNSIGLANPGLQGFIDEKLPFIRTLKTDMVLNVGGRSEDDYISLVEQIDFEDSIWGYEINISCPNVKHGGLAFGTDTKLVESLTKRIRKITKKPIIMKLTPNVTSIADIAKAAEAGGADGVSAINTLKGMVIDIHKQKPSIPAGIAGLSGAAIRPVGVASVYQISRAVKIPVIGMGGIFTAEDAIQYLLAGATSIQVGTANFIDVEAPLKVLDGIKEYMKLYNLKKIEDFHTIIN